MQKISAIIDQLTNSDLPLSSPLLETKVLATRIKNDELLSWVNQEIEGYDIHATLPNYRIGPGILKGSYVIGNTKVTNTALPIPDISEDIVSLLTKSKIRQSCSALENLLKSGQEKGAITFSLSGDIVQLLQDVYSQQISYFYLYSAYVITSVSIYHDALAIMRSRLLDLMLRLENEFGDTATISDLKSGNTMINSYVQNIIFNHGSGNMINTGNESTLTS